MPELDQMTMGLRGTKITEIDTEMQRALETFAEVFGTMGFLFSTIDLDGRK